MGENLKNKRGTADDRDVMSSGFNRALQMRVANRLRAELARDELSGLPLIDGLREVDQRELCDVGGGRVAALCISLPSSCERIDALVEQISGEIRRTDLLAVLDPTLLVVLSPGLEPTGGQSLVDRLRDVCGHEVTIAIAYRSGASLAGWTARELAAEALLYAQGQIVLDGAPATAIAIAS
jgi:hypothetical protein